MVPYGWWNREVIVRAQGGITDNAVSGPHQRHCHTDKISRIITNMIPVLIRIEKGKGG